MDVVCRKYSCVYNDRAKCDRKNLLVNDCSHCKSIEIDNNRVVEDVSKDMFCHEPDVAPYHHCKTMQIGCDTTQCVFNRDGECFSNGIFVGSEKQEAPCNSFVPRWQNSLTNIFDSDNIFIWKLILWHCYCYDVCRSRHSFWLCWKFNWQHNRCQFFNVKDY